MSMEKGKQVDEENEENWKRLTGSSKCLSIHQRLEEANAEKKQKEKSSSSIIKLVMRK